jgi:hypothetical protein
VRDLGKAALAGTLVATLALTACGDSDGDGGGGGKKSGAGGASACIERWNGETSPDLKAKASLSHRGDTGEADVLVGRYTGKAFRATGDSFDASGGTTSTEVAVSPGDCAAVDLTSNDTQTNWVMVRARTEGGGKRGWYFLDETGEHPLAKPPPPLDQTAKTAITGLGEEAKLSTEAP